jgi:hypothetical protein
MKSMGFMCCWTFVPGDYMGKQLPCAYTWFCLAMSQYFYICLSLVNYCTAREGEWRFNFQNSQKRHRVCWVQYCPSLVQLFVFHQSNIISRLPGFGVSLQFLLRHSLIAVKPSKRLQQQQCCARPQHETPLSSLVICVQSSILGKFHVICRFFPFGEAYGKGV